MKKIELKLPELALVAGTRGMLGVGIGLLVADKVPQDRRKIVGLSLLLVGAISTVPLAMEIFGKRKRGWDWLPRKLRHLL